MSLPKHVLVTGGTSGIGYAIAEALAREEATVHLVARTGRDLEAAERNLGVRAGGIFAYATDLSDRLQLEALVEQVLGRCSGKLDALVNNAGVARFASFSDTTADDYNHHFDLNVRAPILLTRSLLPALTAARGSVLDISSYFARRMVPETPSALYSASKGALESLTRALAVELGPLGVRVNAIAPGTVETPLVVGNLARMDDVRKAAFDAHLVRNVPLGRMGAPEEVAALASMLVGA